MSTTILEQWKADWNVAFTPEALASAVTMQYAQLNRTFVRVQMLSKNMMKTWFDLLKQNHPRLISSGQLSTAAPGPCTLYMCYLTSNHVDIRDPSAISSIVPMYVNAPLLCYQGLMELDRTFTGTTNPEESVTLLVMSAKMAPRDDGVAFQYIFISPKPSPAKTLREIMDAKDINYNRCVAGTLYSIYQNHAKKKCTCSLTSTDWKEVGLFPDTTKYEVRLPCVTFQGAELGYINVPWATGKSFDIIKQNGWSIEDEAIAAISAEWHRETDFLKLKAEKASFLSVLMGVTGIHVIEFAKFVTLDPLELPEKPSQAAPGSASKP
jgi:hypothetical protein